LGHVKSWFVIENNFSANLDEKKEVMIAASELQVILMK
jgi:hypothetical protein